MLPSDVKRAMEDLIGILRANGETNKIERLLTNPFFIQERARHFGVDVIYQDIDGLASENLEKIGRVLKRSEHVIRRHPEQTKQQLLLRMPDFNWQASNSSEEARLTPESLNLSTTDTNDLPLQTIPTPWKRRGFADRIFPNFCLANDQKSVFLTFPDDCKVVQYSLKTGEVLDTHNFDPNFAVYADQADRSYPITEAVAKLSDERFLISVTSQNADTFEIEHTLVECDLMRKRLSRFWRGSKHPIRHIFLAGDSLILVTIKDVVFTTVDSFNTESATNRLVIETHENSWIKDAYLLENFLVLTSSGNVSVVDIISKKLLHKMSLADFLQKEPEWHDIGFGFLNLVPTFKDSEFLVSYDSRRFLFDAEKGLLIRELPLNQGRYLVENASQQILIADGNDLLLLDLDGDESIPVLTGTGGEFLQIELLGDQKQYLTFNTNGDFQFWNWGPGELESSINRINLGSSIEGICPIGGGDWIAWTSSGQVYLKQNAHDKMILLAEYSQQLIGIESHPWHPMIIITAKGLIDTWSLETRKRLIGYQFYESDSITSSLSEDGFRIYAITVNGIIMCSVFQQRWTTLSYEWTSDEKARILEWPDGQHILIKSGSGRTLLVDQYNRKLVFDYGGSGWGWLDLNRPTDLSYLEEAGEVCFGFADTIEIWNADFTKKRAGKLYLSDGGFPMSVLHLEKPGLLLIDDGLYLDQSSLAQLKSENSRSNMQMVDHSTCNRISIAIDKNTLRVGATLSPGNSVSLTLDSEISDAKFIDGSDKILVGDKVGNIACLRLDLPSDFTEMDKELVTSEKTEYRTKIYSDVKMPKPKVFYPSVDRSEYCFFCNEHKPKQSLDVMEKSICLTCINLINPTLGHENPYSSPQSCTMCGNHADREEKTELEFRDILFQRLCEDCVKLLRSKTSEARFAPEKVETCDNEVKKWSKFRNTFQRQSKTNPPLHWLYKKLKKNDEEAIAELAEEIGSPEIAMKIGDAFAMKELRSLSYDQKFENIDNEIKALCMVLEDNEPDFEGVSWLLEQIDDLETPYTLYRFAATVSDYPYYWASHAERAAHRAVEINREFAIAWQVLANVRYSMKMDVIGASNAYVHYSRCENLDASILIEAAEFDLTHFKGPCANAAEYLETAEAMLNSYQTYSSERITELREKFSDKLDE